jgi:phosphoribosylaminoimidazolecarboxamide formyltransferase/IMP cyclohydrolase
MKSRDGDLAQKTRVELAKKVFRHTSRYDAVIADYLTSVTGNVQ